jgi:beta-glucosidase-like glycosyl hydrolase
VELEDGTIKCPTSFPNPINFGQTWNDSLYFELGSIIATETRALWLLSATEYDPWTGLPRIGPSCWSPK